MTRWAILTGEYPPQPGGVSDYTRQVAHGLVAAGDRVTIYSPASPGPEPGDDGPCVRRLPDHFGPAGLLALDRFLAARPQVDRILIQYVPHAFGCKAMNLSFAAWTAVRAPLIAPVTVMFHEVVFPFSWRPATHAVLGMVTAAMARLVACAADRVYVSIPAWGSLLHKLYPRAKPAEWLPVPSNIPSAAALGVPRFRSSLPEAGTTVLGHFGTYGTAIGVLLEPALRMLLAAKKDRVVLLLGRGSQDFRARMSAQHPGLAGRVIATGALPPDELAGYLRSCDLLVQPYPDGISSRRGSAMAGLANAVPMVSNLGALSEPLWTRARCVALAQAPDPQALADTAETVLACPARQRQQMGQEGAVFYRDYFSLENTICRLRGGSSARPLLLCP